MYVTLTNLMEFLAINIKHIFLLYAALLTGCISTSELYENSVSPTELLQNQHKYEDKQVTLLGCIEYLREHNSKPIYSIGNTNQQSFEAIAKGFDIVNRSELSVMDLRGAKIRIKNSRETTVVLTGKFVRKPNNVHLGVITVEYEGMVMPAKIRKVIRHNCE